MMLRSSWVQLRAAAQNVSRKRTSNAILNITAYNGTFSRAFSFASQYEEDFEVDAQRRNGGSGRGGIGGSRYGPAARGGQDGGFKGGFPDSRPERSFDSFGPKLGSVDWDAMELPDIVKGRYTEHPEVQAMSREDVLRWREEHEVEVDGETPEDSRPILSFDYMNVPSVVRNVMDRRGFKAPSAIQAQAWAVALNGKDMVGISQTGSGKTLAYLLPAMAHIGRQDPMRRGDGPLALVVAPTRELAIQIQEECSAFARPCNIRTAVLYGGSPRGRQMRELSFNPHLVICTPGRLQDLLSVNATNLRRVGYLVLDEADRMLDMGFEPQLRQIVSQIPPQKQTLMWSATWPKEVRNIARTFMNDYVKVTVGSDELSCNKNIEHRIIPMGQYDKYAELSRILTEDWDKSSRVLVFVQTKRGADELCESLLMDGHRVVSLHGDKDQRQRTQVMRMFREGSAPVVIATDVAARGIDVKDIQFVVNFDMPNNIEDWTHRVGRTGRAGSSGIAYSFFCREDSSLAGGLSSVLREVNQPLPPVVEQLAHRPPRGRGSGGKSRGGRGGPRGGQRGRALRW